MTSLDTLFGSDRRSHDGPASIDSDGSARKLSALVGEPDRVAPPAPRGSDRSRLAAMVSAAAHTAAPIVASKQGAASSKRRRARGIRRTDWVNAIAAAVAGVVVLATAGFAGVEVANASPASGALRVLAADEAALENAQQGLAGSRTRLEESISTALADVALLRAGIDTVADVDDPDAHAAVLQAADAYRAGLEGVALPEAVERYERPRLDEDSLGEVGAAIDEVREASVSVDEAVAEVRDARATVEALGATFATALQAYAATFAPLAEEEVEDNSLARQSVRDAVTVAAGSVAASLPNGAPGAALLVAYRDAVLALRDGDDRAAEEAEREATRDRQNVRRTQPNPTPTEQTPVDPGTEVPPPTEPEPGTEGGGVLPGF